MIARVTKGMFQFHACNKPRSKFFMITVLPQQRQRKWFYGRNLRLGLTYHKKLPILLSFSPFFLKSNFSLRTQIDLGTKRLFSMFFVSIEWLFSYSI